MRYAAAGRRLASRCEGQPRQARAKCSRGTADLCNVQRAMYDGYIDVNSHRLVCGGRNELVLRSAKIQLLDFNNDNPWIRSDR